MALNTAKVSEALENYDSILRFNPDDLARTAELGEAFDFSGIVPKAKEIIAYYEAIPRDSIPQLPPQIFENFFSLSSETYQVFGQITTFNPTTTANPNQTHSGLSSQLLGNHQKIYQNFAPILVHDLLLKNNTTGIPDSLQKEFDEYLDQANRSTKSIMELEDKIKNLAQGMQDAAAEQGVTQQAVFFKQLADRQMEASGKWKAATICMTIAIAVYAIGSLFIHKLPWLVTESIYETAQIAISKALIFGILSYILYLCAKNFIVLRHNSIVNEHRHTALVTFTALAEAATDPKQKDVVLNYAASCIFSPQPTGYTDGDGKSQQPVMNSFIDLIGKSGQSE